MQRKLRKSWNILCAIVNLVYFGLGVRYSWHYYWNPPVEGVAIQFGMFAAFLASVTLTLQSLSDLIGALKEQERVISYVPWR